MFEGLVSWKMVSLSFVALGIVIGLVKLRIRLGASITVSLSKRLGGSYFLVIKNSGPGTAFVKYVWALENNSSRVDFQYAGDRNVFPFRLGSGASYELTLTRQEAGYSEVRVKWKDGFHIWSHSERIPISQFVPSVQ